MLRVELIGGPLDGEVLEYPPADLEGRPVDELGAYMVVPDRRAHPEDPGARAVYEPQPGGDPLRWTWRGWVP